MRLRFWGWLFSLFIVCTLLVIKLQQEGVIETNIMALLPETEQQPEINNLASEFISKNNSRAVFLFGNKDKKIAIKAAEEFTHKLRQSKLWKNTVLRHDRAQQQAFYHFYYPYRYQRLTASQQQALKSRTLVDWEQAIQQQLLNPTQMVSSRLLQSDPLLLFNKQLQHLSPATSTQLSLVDDLLMVEAKGVYYVLISSEVTFDVFNLRLQHQAVVSIERWVKHLQEKYVSTEAIYSGVLFHAEAGARNAQSDISFISIISIIGIIILTRVIFRSLQPVGFCLLTIGVGVLVAFTLTSYLFDKVHWLTLVFGASLIGISVDYTFHYFTARQAEAVNFSSKRVIQQITPAIGLGMLSSIIGYIPMMAAPFPGIVQIGFFSASGLLAAFLTVILFLPYLCEQPSSNTGFLNQQFLLSLHQYHLHCASKKSLWGILILCLMGALALFINLPVNDDIRLLQQLSPERQWHDQQLKALTGQNAISQFYIVTAETEEALLEKQEKLLIELAPLIKKGALAHARSVVQWVPSKRQQMSNLKLLNLKMPTEQLRLLLDKLGFTADAKQKALAAYQSQLKISSPEKGTEVSSLLTIHHWFSSSVSQYMSNLWLGKYTQGYAAVVQLTDVNDLAALRHLTDKDSDIFFISKADDITTVLSRYRQLIVKLAFMAYLFIYIFLGWRYGWFKALFIMLPPLTAALTAIALVGTLVQPINLFNILAFILIMGIGIDYTLFLQEDKKRRLSTYIAILLSAGTTVLAFGLLSLSSTNAVQTFGFTVLIGILLAFLWAPCSLRKNTRSCLNDSDVKQNDMKQQTKRFSV
ncbi:MMPL family transporter [Zooshikella harenae]|uniref:MMPL family transporter n=1 Tax=Zooshikella harenae TaxID=2827238 RepID=A0ABS5ZB19_9GAMM|nr:MMPL family transporter [Zooshikella harenae]MBU2711262.1 MMPL family transporter [Zooshikella harenae]